MRVDLGPFFRSIASFFAASTHPAIVAAAPTVTQPLQQAADAAEAALPAVASSMANDALAHIPEGQLFSAIADMLIDQTIANLLAKKSPTPFDGWCGGRGLNIGAPASSPRPRGFFPLNLASGFGCWLLFGDHDHNDADRPNGWLREQRAANAAIAHGNPERLRTGGRYHPEGAQRCSRTVVRTSAARPSRECNAWPAQCLQHGAPHSGHSPRYLGHAQLASSTDLVGVGAGLPARVRLISSRRGGCSQRPLQVASRELRQLACRCFVLQSARHRQVAERCSQVVPSLPFHLSCAPRAPLRREQS